MGHVFWWTLIINGLIASKWRQLQIILEFVPMLHWTHSKLDLILILLLFTCDEKVVKAVSYTLHLTATARPTVLTTSRTDEVLYMCWWWSLVLSNQIKLLSLYCLLFLLPYSLRSWWNLLSAACSRLLQDERLERCFINWGRSVICRQTILILFWYCWTWWILGRIGILLRRNYTCNIPLLSNRCFL